MRLVLLTLILSLFIGYAEAEQTTNPDWRDTVRGLVSEVQDLTAQARTEVARAVEERQRIRNGEHIAGMDPEPLDAHNMQSSSATVNSTNLNMAVERDGEQTVWTAAAGYWQQGKDYTSQVAGKISDKVSTSVNAKIEPQMQKMRDMRDQIHTTWLWIKWSIFFVIALFTVYILEPYVSLVNTLLGFVGLAKRRDATQEQLEALTAEIKELKEQLAK